MRDEPALRRLQSPLLMVLLWRIYAMTARPEVTVGDAGELMVASSLMCSAHPPGYPLWVFASKIVSFLPLGSSAWRLSLLSQMCVVLSVCLVARLPDRMGRGVAGAGGLLAALALGTSHRIWDAATSIEVYGLHLLIFALVLHGAYGRRKGQWRSLALLMGLGFSNHHTFVAAIPLLGLLLARKPRTWRLGMHAAPRWLSLFVLGLAPYLLLPLRGDVSCLPGWADHGHIQGVIDTLTRMPYQGANPFRSMAWSARQQWAFLKGVGHDLSLPFLLAAGVGLVTALRRNPFLALPSIACLLISGPLLTFWANAGLDEDAMSILDPFYAPCELIVALYAGLGLGVWVQRWGPHWGHVILLAISLRACWAIPAWHARGQWWGLSFIQYMDRALPRQCGVLTSSDPFSFLLQLMLRVEGRGDRRAAMTQKVPYWDKLLSQGLPGIPLPSVAALRSWQQGTAIPVDQASQWVHDRVLESSTGATLFWEPHASSVHLWTRLKPCGILLVRAGDAIPPLEDFSSWIRRSQDRFPTGAEAHFFSGLASNLGTYDWSVGRKGEALAQWRQALWMCPDSVAPWGNMGAVFVRQGQLDAAEELLLHAVSLDPNYYDGLFNLSLAEMALGDREGARRWAEKALRSNPRRPEARKILFSPQQFQPQR